VASLLRSKWKISTPAGAVKIVTTTSSKLSGKFAYLNYLVVA